MKKKDWYQLIVENIKRGFECQFYVYGVLYFIGWDDKENTIIWECDSDDDTTQTYNDWEELLNEFKIDGKTLFELRDKIEPEWFSYSEASLK